MAHGEKETMTPKGPHVTAGLSPGDLVLVGSFPPTFSRLHSSQQGYPDRKAPLLTMAPSSTAALQPFHPQTLLVL